MTFEEKDQMLIDAARSGNVHEVERLITLFDPAINHISALFEATQSGHLNCVKLLIPRSNTKTITSMALQMAAYLGHMNCVDFLFDISDPQSALDHMKFYFPGESEKWQYLADKIESVQQQTLLAKEVKSSTDKPTPPRKI